MASTKIVAALFVGLSLFSSVSSARVVMKDEVQPFNWTGFYVGLNAGLVKHTMNITDNDASAFLATIQQTSDPKFTGGFQIGYRRQIDFAPISSVFGAEFSANFSDTSFSHTYGSPFGLYLLDSNNSLKQVYLLQIMGGIAANRALLFVTGGLSWINVNGTTTNSFAIPFSNSFSVNKRVVGSVLGAGIEYAFTDALSVRAKVDVVAPNVYTTSDDAGNTFSIMNNIVQATLGINYKFA